MNLYRKVLAGSLFVFTTIVFTGALVRLSDSGLGCEDWPQCSTDQLIPAWSFHSWVEFGNRLYSGIVALVALGLVWATHKLDVESKMLGRLSWLVLLGTTAQVLVGAITVKSDLNPLPVTVHFLLSMILIWALLLMLRTVSGPTGHAAAPPFLRRGAVLLALWATVVLTTGTIVTGTGPHGGDSRADRLRFDIQTVARIHSATVWILLAGFVVFALMAHQMLGPSDPRTSSLRFVLAAIVVQGGIGYLQYALGVPAGLVLAHVVGSVMVWSAVVWVSLMFSQTSWFRYAR